VQSAQSDSAGSVPVPRQNTQQQPIAQAQGSNAQQQQQQQQQQQGGQSIDAQFMDLSSRIQLISHATNNVIRELSNQGTRADSRQTELLQRMATKEQVAGLDARLQRMESLLQNIQRDLAGKDYRERFSQLEKTLQSSHLSLTESLQGHILHVMTASTPRMGFFIFVIIGVQVLLAGSYIVYKRRKANMPKKFL
jgi:mannose-binding lectin 1